MEKKYYGKLDLIRVIACIAILLYHIGILKGGYLAVCTFFVLSGYLSVISCFKKEKISLKEYYLNKLKKIYIPLLVTVFITILVVSLIPSIDWVNLKPETTSVLLGYNNYWQLNANLDYFVRHINSPFTHLWYIGILIQFDLIFPFLFMILRKLGRKVSKILPIILTIAPAILSFLCFTKLVNDGRIMNAYYGTFTRSFSFLAGISLGFIHAYYKHLVIKKLSLRKVVFIIYLAILGLMFLFVDAKSNLLNLSMILTTLVTMRLLSYSVTNSKYEIKFSNIISSLAKVSYEIYLVQYPVIFLIQDMKISSLIKVPLIIIITVIISYIIHYAINFKKGKGNVVKIGLLIIVSVLTLIGFGKYIITKDYTGQMKKLEADLNNNRKLIDKKQKEYEEKMKNQEDEWKKFLEDDDQTEEKLKEAVRNMKIVGVGDSVMELAVKNLYKEFPNGYFEAATNRTEKDAFEVIKDLKDKKILGDVLLLNIGTNGYCNVSCKEKLIDIVGDDVTIFWVNATRPDYDVFNDFLIEFAEKHDNVHIIDWITVMKENPGYLIRDGVHPNVKGCGFYAETLYNKIYEYYLNEYKSQKEEKIKEHEQEQKNKLTFIGNDLLVGIFDELDETYPKSEFIIDQDFTYKSLNNTLKDKKVSDNIIFMFDKKADITKKEYNNLIETYKDKNIYIIDTTNSLKFNNDNVKVINFKLKDKYTMVDGIHLTDDGNKALLDLIKNNIKKTDK